MKNLCFLIAVSFLCMVNCDKKINNNNDEPNFLKINIGENSVITNGLKGYIILYTDENCSTIKETRFFPVNLSFFSKIFQTPQFLLR